MPPRSGQGTGADVCGSRRAGCHGCKRDCRTEIGTPSCSCAAAEAAAHSEQLHTPKRTCFEVFAWILRTSCWRVCKSTSNRSTVAPGTGSVAGGTRRGGDRQVTGGGSQLDEDGSVAYVDVEVALANLDDAVSAVIFLLGTRELRLAARRHSASHTHRLAPGVTREVERVDATILNAPHRTRP